MIQPTQFGKDTQLRTRMFITMLLLGALYGMFIWVMLSFGQTWMLGIVVVIVLIQFAASDKMVLASMRAKVVTRDEAPKLHRIVERLVMSAGIPMPKVAISDLAVPNAFATGRSQKHAAVAVTQGLLQILDDDELEAVLAHEISHIRTKDVVVMTYASFFLIVASMLSSILMFSAIFGGMGRSRNNNSGSIIMVALLVTFIVRIIGGMLVATLSRYREFSADRGAAILTRRPLALASALQKLQGSIPRVPKDDLRKAESMNAFFIMSAVGPGLAELFSSHPSTEKRVQRLKEYETQAMFLR
ncbi:MAG: zinc metalloprotease HtpX [Chloroflexi bacterium]|nr:zinc metalloprotease HtpX [Chloroflexota bacterium]